MISLCNVGKTKIVGMFFSDLPPVGVDGFSQRLNKLQCWEMPSSFPEISKTHNHSLTTDREQPGRWHAFSALVLVAVIAPINMPK